MSGKLVIHGTNSGTNYGKVSAVAEHENGQTFYCPYRAYRQGMSAHDSYVAVFQSLPAGNYTVKESDHSYDRRKVSIFDGQEIEVRF